MDGSQKLPQRIIGTMNDLADLNKPAPLLINVLNTWIAYLATSDFVNDPLASEIIKDAKAKNFENLFNLLAAPLNPKYLPLLTGEPLNFE